MSTSTPAVGSPGHWSFKSSLADGLVDTCDLAHQISWTPGEKTWKNLYCSILDINWYKLYICFGAITLEDSINNRSQVLKSYTILLWHDLAEGEDQELYKAGAQCVNDFKHHFRNCVSWFFSFSETHFDVLSLCLFGKHLKTWLHKPHGCCCCLIRVQLKAVKGTWQPFRPPVPLLVPSTATLEGVANNTTFGIQKQN